MSVKYVKFSVAIHGIDAEDDVVIGFMRGWLKAAVKAELEGNMKDYFKFRDGFESDIEIELDEYAGEFTVSNSDS